MQEYFQIGFWYLVRSVVPALVVYIVYSLILMVSRKRNFKDFHSLPKAKMMMEFILTVYVCAILDITGIIGMHVDSDFSKNTLAHLFSVPFVGSSIKMIALNVMLFVPYGFLCSTVFQQAASHTKKRLNWKWALLVGFCSSFCIEILQIFSGRLCEVDDLIANTGGFLIGFLIMQALQKIRIKKERKKGIMQAVIIIVATVVVMVLLSFVANGDKLQEETDAYYNGMGNDEDLSAISAYRVYSDGRVFDVKEDMPEDGELWYRWMGDDIGNISGRYEIERCSAITNDIVEQKPDALYIEIVYENKQLFRFYNNQEWSMEDISHIVYCVEDRTLWYGSDNTSLEYCARYADEDDSFLIDENIVDGIQEWLAGNRE